MGPGMWQVRESSVNSYRNVAILVHVRRTFLITFQDFEG